MWSEDQLDSLKQQMYISLTTFTFYQKAAGLIYNLRPTVVPRLVSCFWYSTDISLIQDKQTVDQQTTIEPPRKQVKKYNLYITEYNENTIGQNINKFVTK